MPLTEISSAVCVAGCRPAGGQSTKGHTQKRRGETVICSDWGMSGKRGVVSLQCGSQEEQRRLVADGAITGEDEVTRSKL